MSGTRNATKKLVAEGTTASNDDPAEIDSAVGDDLSAAGATATVGATETASAMAAAGRTAAAGTPMALAKTKQGKKPRFPCGKCDARCL